MGLVEQGSSFFDAPSAPVSSLEQKRIVTQAIVPGLDVGDRNDGFQTFADFGITEVNRGVAPFDPKIFEMKAGTEYDPDMGSSFRDGAYNFTYLGKIICAVSKARSHIWVIFSSCLH